MNKPDLYLMARRSSKGVHKRISILDYMGGHLLADRTARTRRGLGLYSQQTAKPPPPPELPDTIAPKQQPLAPAMGGRMKQRRGLGSIGPGVIKPSAPPPRPSAPPPRSARRNRQDHQRRGLQRRHRGYQRPRAQVIAVLGLGFSRFDRRARTSL